MEAAQIQKYTDMLMELPKSIRSKQNSILSISEEVLEIQQEISQIEGDLKTEIANESDPNGKKAFTNAETRDLEFKARSLDNQELITLKEKYNVTNRIVQGLRHDVEMEQNVQRNIRAVLGSLSPAIY